LWVNRVTLTARPVISGIPQTAGLNISLAVRSQSATL
jgi:hypothetical protein